MISPRPNTGQTSRPQAALLSLFLLLASLCASNAWSETWRIEQAMATETRAWNAEFDVAEDADTIVVAINVSLAPSSEVRRVALDGKIPTWEAVIEDTWGDRFTAHIDDREIPIEIRVRFTHHQPHHRVIIRPGSWNPNQHNWYVDTPPHVVAHEIGHMLGAYDEYRGGALDPETDLVDIHSVMGSRSAGGEAWPRHLRVLEESLASRYGGAEIVVRQRVSPQAWIDTAPAS